ncbi:MAG TPA: 2-amino-4-hydroxy-6-hydroxymethyldihydropteridine diphosphokinase [Acidimicrobiia bacterium]|nr:2-amino-4-hydroxy-6-hydroxymethyldihydropteridine diphosphokinase [Acidimicrobiia bacterium]
MSRRAYLAIGSNLGDRLAYLQLAVDGLASAPGVTVVAASPVYETEPVGGPEQPQYLNAVVAVDTTLDARGLLHLAQRLESDAARVRQERWGPRTLDVDVLLVGEETIEAPDLVVPHPRMFERGFVMAPLADLGPAVRLPEPPPAGWPGVHRTGLTLVVP